MQPVALSVEFTGRKARTLARLAAYTLLLTFLFSVVTKVLPLPLTSATSALNVLAELIERSSQPLIATVLLYLGMAEDAMPAIWECRLSLLLRPLLRGVPVLYLLIALAVGVLSHRLETQTSMILSAELQSTLNGLSQARTIVARLPDTAALQRFIARQPSQTAELFRQAVPENSNVPLVQQRETLDQTIEAMGPRLSRQFFKRRADASGAIITQALRLILSSLSYAVFFLFAGFAWPTSLIDTVERIRIFRNKRDAENEAAPN